MKQFFRRLMDTEFLPMSEVRKIKVILVMAFLLLIAVLSVPFSIFFTYSLAVKIIVIAALVIGYALMIGLLQLGKILPAIHLSIIYSISLTLFYTQGTSGIYAYLFFYISLTIIIFYQELYSYLLYGTLVTGIGVWYIITHQAALVMATDVPGAIYIYVIILVLFYLIFLIQILYNEKMYTDMNYDWVKINKMVDKYQEDTYIYLDELRKQAKKPALHEDTDFQKAVDELIVFIGEQVKESGKDIVNVFDLYLYIHERGLEKILENEEISVAMKKAANKLDKYLLNRRTDMISMILNFFLQFKKTPEYDPERYQYNLGKLAYDNDGQIIAVAMLFQYLAREVTGKDEWDQVRKVLSLEEIDSLFSSLEAEEFLTSAQVALFKDNYDLFVKYLAKNSERKE